MIEPGIRFQPRIEPLGPILPGRPLTLRVSMDPQPGDGGRGWDGMGADEVAIEVMVYGGRLRFDPSPTDSRGVAGHATLVLSRHGRDGHVDVPAYVSERVDGPFPVMASFSHRTRHCGHAERQLTPG